MLKKKHNEVINKIEQEPSFIMKKIRGTTHGTISEVGPSQEITHTNTDGDDYQSIDEVDSDDSEERPPLMNFHRYHYGPHPPAQSPGPGYVWYPMPVQNPYPYGSFADTRQPLQTSKSKKKKKKRHNPPPKFASMKHMNRPYGNMPPPTHPGMYYPPPPPAYYYPAPPQPNPYSYGHPPGYGYPAPHPAPSTGYLTYPVPSFKSERFFGQNKKNGGKFKKFMPKHTSEVAIKHKKGKRKQHRKNNNFNGFSRMDKRNMFRSSKTMGSRLLGMNSGIDIQEIEDEDEESDESLNRAEL